LRHGDQFLKYLIAKGRGKLKKNYKIDSELSGNVGQKTTV